MLDNITIAEVVKVLGGLGLAFAFIRKAWPWLRRFVTFVNDLIGEPERDGVSARPGVMTRLQAIEAGLDAKSAAIESLAKSVDQVRAEVTTNGGGSLKDAVLRLECVVGDLAANRDPSSIPSPRTSPEEPREDHH